MKNLFVAQVILRSCLSLALVFPPTISSNTTAEEPDRRQQVEKLERYVDLVAEIRRHLDRTQFDLSAAIDHLDYDADSIIDFVTEEIRFEPYAGSLRGGQGTLMSRAGNSLDQSLLLATLLKDAGFDARISRSKIEESDANDLVQGVALEKLTPSSIGDEEKIRTLFHQLLVDVSGASEEAARTQVESLFDKTEQPQVSEATQSNAQFVVEKTGPIFTDEHRSVSELVLEAQDYFWVEWRDSASSEWSSVHPAFSQGTPEGFVVSKEETFDGEIPVELSFRFSVELTLEQQLGQKTNTKLLGKSPSIPTANLVGTPITVTLTPNSITKPEDLIDLERTLGQANIWVPTINGATTSYAFDYMGNAIDSLVAGAPGAGLFQTVGGGFASAAGALAGNDKDEPIASINHVWIDYVVMDPVRGERRSRTDLISSSLINRDGNSPDKDLVRKGLLSSSHTAMLAMGDYPASYVLDRSLERAQELARFTKDQLENGPEHWVGGLAQLKTDFIGHLDFFETVDSSLAFDYALSFRPAPNILVFSQALYPPKDTLALLNIIDNPRRTLKRDGGVLKQSPELNIVAGVWESTLEGLMLENAGRSSFSAAQALTTIADEGGSFELITSNEKLDANSTLQESSTGDWVDTDLKRNRSILIPSKQITSPESTDVWWRVDNSSGSTLAVMNGGYGISLTQEVIFKITLGAAFIGMQAAFWGCMGGFGDGDGQPPDATSGKVLSCSVCGLFAFATTYLVVGTILTQGPTAFAAWRAGGGVTISIPTTAASQLKRMAWEVAGVIMGVFCGIASVAD